MSEKTPEQQAQAALNYLIGQVMAKTQGRANPQVVRRLIVDRVVAEAERRLASGEAPPPDPANPVP